MATKNHLLLVLEKFNKDQHGLLEVDINVRISKVFHLYNEFLFLRKCLETIDEVIVYEGMQF